MKCDQYIVKRGAQSNPIFSQGKSLVPVQECCKHALKHFYTTSWEDITYMCWLSCTTADTRKVYIAWAQSMQGFEGAGERHWGGGHQVFPGMGRSGRWGQDLCQKCYPHSWVAWTTLAYSDLCHQFQWWQCWVAPLGLWWLSSGYWEAILLAPGWTTQHLNIIWWQCKHASLPFWEQYRTGLSTL